MAKNLSLGRILALMPHCCNKNGNGNSITTVEHTLNLNQGNILDLSGDNNKQISGMYIASCNEEDYNKFIEDSLNLSNFGYSVVDLLEFMANSENDLQTSLEITLDSTTYALMIGILIGYPLSPESTPWCTHNPNLPITTSSHNSLIYHPISLEDLVSENGVKIYSLGGNFGNISSINEVEDFRLYCQYNSEINKLTLSVVPVIKQNNLVSTVTVNDIVASDSIELPEIELPEIKAIKQITGEFIPHVWEPTQGTLILENYTNNDTKGASEEHLSTSSFFWNVQTNPNLSYARFVFNRTTMMSGSNLIQIAGGITNKLYNIPQKGDIYYFTLEENKPVPANFDPTLYRLVVTDLTITDSEQSTIYTFNVDLQQIASPKLKLYLTFTDQTQTEVLIDFPMNYKEL